MKKFIKYYLEISFILITFVSQTLSNILKLLLTNTKNYEINKNFLVFCLIEHIFIDMKQNNLKKKYQILVRRFYNTNIKSQRAAILLGIDKSGFINHIDKYRLNGMTNENFGKVWGLDHIVPVEIFDLNNVDDFSLCYNYNNFMPMFNSDNRLKGASVHFSLVKLESMYTNVYIEKLKAKCNKEIISTYNKYISL